MGCVPRTSPPSRSPSRRAEVALILDTGPLLAAIDAGDADHSVCALLLTEASEDLVVPALVLAELDYWCSRRLGQGVWLTFLDEVIAGVYRVEAPTLADLERCRALQHQYADVGLGVVDASVIALAERSGETKVATLDRRHFGTVRPRHIPGFELRP